MAEKSSDRTPQRVQSRDNEFEHVVPLSECVILKGEAFNEVWRHWKTTGSQESIDLILRSVFRLINTIAYKLHRPYKIPLQDAFQLGSMGAFRAAQKFNPDLGFEFSTYAVSWINQFITRAGGEYTEIRFPIHAYQDLRKLYRARNHLSTTLEREPTVSEIATHLEWLEAKVKEFQAHLLLQEEVRFESMPNETMDIHSLQDHQAKNTDDTPERKTQSSYLRRHVLELLKGFDARERTVLELRTLADFFDTESLTLAEIGKILGISREYVRQIEMRAIKKFKDLIKNPQEGELEIMYASTKLEDRKEVWRTLLSEVQTNGRNQIESTTLAQMLRKKFGLEQHESVANLVKVLKEDQVISVASGTRSSTVWEIRQDILEQKLGLVPQPSAPSPTSTRLTVQPIEEGKSEKTPTLPTPAFQGNDPEVVVEKYGDWLDKHGELRRVRAKRLKLEKKLEKAKKREASLEAELLQQPREVELMVRLHDSIDARLNNKT